MKVHRGYDDLQLVRPVVTLGTFDGVHLGHVQLINAVIDAAHKEGGESVIITFNPHPRQVVGNENHEFFLLTTLAEKLALLEGTGIDHVIIQEFSREFAAIGACDFLSEVLVKRTGTRKLIMGYDHKFGREGEGDINKIRQCAELSELCVEQVHALVIGGKPVSSSLIRDALASGRLDEANGMLGYSYCISGSVVRGNQIGRTIGFPTANISIDDECKLIPGNGVYAVEVLLEKDIYKGILSIGTNPTVTPGNSKRSIEVHIIDFTGDIYGKPITVRFRKRLREERRYVDTVELSRQIELDKLEALRVLP
jgi:riboflavin kinase/FMN adenylyltransferase